MSTLRSRLESPALLVRICLASIALAGLSRLLVHPAGPGAKDLVDGVSGFFGGVAVATLVGAGVARRAGAPDSD